MFSLISYLIRCSRIISFCLFFMFLCYSDAFSGEFEPGGKPEIEIVNPGAEVLLGTLVNIRKSGAGLFGCGERRIDGIILAEALKWTANELNRKIWSSSSSNISIGLQIMDSCSRSRVATSQLADFLPDLKGEDISRTKQGNENLPFKIGVIDDIGLAKEVDVFNTLEELNIPVIKTDVNINSQQEIVTAVLNIIQELRWDHIALVHSNSRFSLSMLKSFTKSLKKYELCVPWIINIENAVIEKDYFDLQQVLRSGIPIVSLLTSEKHDLLLKNLKEMPRLIKKIPILFTDLVLRSHLKNLPANKVKLLALVPLPEKEVNFEEYFWRNSNVKSLGREDELELMQRTKSFRKIQAIMDKFSANLRELMNDFCDNENRICPRVYSAEGRSSAYERMKDEDWSVERELYGLMEYQFRDPDGPVLLQKILTYNKFRNVDVFEHNLPFVEMNCESDSILNKPECNCLEAKAIRRGSARHMIDQNRKELSPSGEKVDRERITSSTTVKKKIEYFPGIPTAFSSFRDPINAILACLILLGSFFTLFTGQYFATFAALPHGGLTSGTSIIGYFILIGLFFLYVTNLSFILTPSIATCTLRRFGTSSSYAVVFSGMMIKVWAIWKQTKCEKADLAKPSTLVILALSLSVLQILFSGIWLILVPPKTHFDADKWICYPSGELDSHLLVSMIYVIGILLATAVLAIRISAKNNINEARWILISSSLVAVLFSCWGIAIATGVWQFQRTAIVNLASATTLLFCMYIPKVRIHSKLKKSQKNAIQNSLKLADEFPVFTAMPPYPFMVDCNMTPPTSSEDVSESSYSNQAFSIDGGTESMSIPFEVDTSLPSELDQEPLTFSTFFNNIHSSGDIESEVYNDPTQIVPSTLYSLDMFNNEPLPDDKDHCEPGTNEFTPQHRVSSQLYLYPEPEWVP